MSGWAEKADRAARAGQHSYARVCASRARVEQRRTIAEQLDDAATGEEFGAVLGGWITALGASRDEEVES